MVDGMVIFNHQYKRLIVDKVTESRPPSFVPTSKTIEVEAGTLDEKIGNWLFSRFHEDDKVRIEVQIKKDEKLIIKNAFIIKIRPVISPNEITLTRVTIVSQDYVYTLGQLAKKYGVYHSASNLFWMRMRH